MIILLESISILVCAIGLSFLLEKLFGPAIEIRERVTCKHESVNQWWYDRGIRQRKCLSCGKEELSRNSTPSGYIKLWNPKFINGEPISGIELKKMLGHKKKLEEKKLKK